MRTRFAGPLAALSTLLMAVAAQAQTGPSQPQKYSPESKQEASTHGVSTGQQPGTSNSSSSSESSGASDQVSMQQMSKEMALNRIHHINQKELALTQLAQDKAQSPEVKQAAQRIMQDHQKLESRVKDLARSESVELHGFSPSTADQVEMDNLKKLDGARFDQAFLTGMKMGHELALNELRLCSRDASDPRVRQLIQSALPEIQHHEQMVARIKSSSPSKAG